MDISSAAPPADDVQDYTSLSREQRHFHTFQGRRATSPRRGDDSALEGSPPLDDVIVTSTPRDGNIVYHAMPNVSSMKYT